MRTLFRVLTFLLPTQLAFHFWPDFAFIFGIRVDYFSPTIYTTDILIVLLVTLFLKSNLAVFTSFIRKHFLYITVFTLFVFLNILFSLVPQIAIYKWIRVLEWLVLAFVVSKIKLDFKSDFVIPLTVSLMAICLIGILQFISGKSLGGFFYFFGERTFFQNTPGVALKTFLGEVALRPYSIFSHPNSFAGFITAAFPFVFCLERKLIKLVLIILFIALVFLVESVNVYLTLVFLATIIVSLKSSENFRKLFANYFLLILVVISFGQALSSNSLAQTFLGRDDIYNRLWLAKGSGEIFSNHPILGVGLGNFIVGNLATAVPNSVKWLLQPVHNIFLLVLSELGIGGLLAFTYFNIQLLKTLLKNFDNNLPLIISLLIILMTGLLDHYTLTLQQNILLYAVVSGLALRDAKIH